MRVFQDTVLSVLQRAVDRIHILFRHKEIGDKHNPWGSACRWDLTPGREVEQPLRPLFSANCEDMMRDCWDAPRGPECLLLSERVAPILIWPQFLMSKSIIFSWTHGSSGLAQTVRCFASPRLFFIRNLHARGRIDWDNRFPSNIWYELGSFRPCRRKAAPIRRKNVGFYSHNSSDVAISICFLNPVAHNVVPLSWTEFSHVAKAAVIIGSCKTKKDWKYVGVRLTFEMLTVSKDLHQQKLEHFCLQVSLSLKINN